MLTITHAVLHVFDLETGSMHLSSEELDLSERAAKSYVQRHLRKAASSAEARHGEFGPESTFASRLEEYRTLRGGDFLDLSHEVAQWFWEELRRADGIAQTDLLMAEFEETVELKPGDPSQADDAFEGRPETSLCVMLLPRRQSFVHEVGPEGVAIARHDATLPNPTQKVDSYLVVSLDNLAITFHDVPRSIAGQDVCVIPERFLRCTERASSREVISQVSVIVEDVATEYGLTPAVEVSRAKVHLARQANMDEQVTPEEVGRVVFEDNPRAQARFQEEVRAQSLPDEVPVRRGVANRLTRTHRIRTDTGIEISFPSELADRPGYIEFDREPDGHVVITLRNITSVENR